MEPRGPGKQDNYAEDPEELEEQGEPIIKINNKIYGFGFV